MGFDHLAGDARGVKSDFVGQLQYLLEAILRQDHEQAATQCHQEMGAESSLFGPIASLEADGATKHRGGEKTKDEFCCHRRW